MIAPHYRLAIHGLVAPLSVFSFSGEEALSAPYRFVVEFTSDIPAMATAMVLGKRAQLTCIRVACSVRSSGPLPVKTSCQTVPSRAW